MTTFDTLSYVAQTWGLMFLMVLFAASVGYALWPRNKAKFDRAAQMPLEED
jgi:cytochrome c oxidase cbb3-type subunit IV